MSLADSSYRMLLVTRTQSGARAWAEMDNAGQEGGHPCSWRMRKLNFWR